MDSARKTEERAAAWLAKRDSGHWSDADERELQVWLDASTANTVAFIRLEAVWSEAQRLKALGAGVPPGVVPPPNAWHPSALFEPRESAASGVMSRAEPASTTHLPRRSWLRYAVAAGVVLAVVSAFTWYSRTPGPYYRTPVGGLASVPMTDGSKVTLNTDSAIRLAVTEKERGVLLERGEAFFEVAKDPARPFVVSAGHKRVIAVGTKFSVRRNGEDVRVFVTEGKVRLEDDLLAESPPEQQGSVLAAGSVARAGDSGVLVQEKPLAEVEDYLSWRSGYVTFHELPLAEAVAEFNRYNERKIVIEDPQVAAIRVSGKFRSNRFEAFVRLLEEGLPIRAQREQDRIVLTGSQSAGGPSD
jgi:transmembrane sensor